MRNVGFILVYVENVAASEAFYASILGRPTIGFRRLNAMPIASRISARVAGEDHALIGPLMEGLLTDLLPRDDRAVELLGISRHSLDAAIERALREWELTEPLAAR